MDISALDAALDEESEAELDAFTRGKGKARTPNCYARFTLPLYYLPYPGIELPTSLR